MTAAAEAAHLQCQETDAQMYWERRGPHSRLSEQEISAIELPRPQPPKEQGPQHIDKNEG